MAKEKIRPFIIINETNFSNRLFTIYCMYLQYMTNCSDAKWYSFAPIYGSAVWGSHRKIKFFQLNILAVECLFPKNKEDIRKFSFVPTSQYISSSQVRLSFPWMRTKKGWHSASSGNRTRAARVAGEHSTTEPTMLSYTDASSVHPQDIHVA